MKTIWEEEAPGSVRTNRCLIESICDENQTAAMVVCVAPVEAEREEMSKSIMRIQIGSMEEEEDGLYFKTMSIKAT